METRGAVAEWTGDKLTVWTGSQAPFRVRSDLAQALHVPQERVRVVIPDAGGGFGGKHSGECAVEAARLAKAAAKPVSLRWTRQEEFTWAYFRPAGLIEIQGGLDDKGAISAWDFTNYNSGGSAVESPYAVSGGQSRHVPCDTPPLKQGSYRALASTANNFARECFMDELAAAAGADPLAFRLAHLQNQRLRDVLAAVAKKFGWAERAAKKGPDVGFGLACGTEKGSYVAACAEVSVDRKSGAITVRRVAQAFECGAIQNPQNLLYQVQGAIIMGLGGALTEEIRFAGGKLLTDRFSKYRVPRMRDVPPIEIELLDRPDLAPAGGGETPIIAIAPAVGNAVFDATGVRVRSMPLRDPALKKV
jgi:isoquinoline 1-oxidoreductase